MSNNNNKTKKEGLFDLRSAILVVACALYIKVVFITRALPYGPAAYISKEERPVFAPIDHDNVSLRAKSGKLRKIYEHTQSSVDHDGGGKGQEVHLMKGPETVVIGNDGTIYVLTEEGKLLSLSNLQNSTASDSIELTAEATEVVNLGMGRPLGGKIAQDGTLYVADSILGLTRVRNFKKKGAKVELIASRVQVVDDDGDGKKKKWSPLLFVNDVDIGPKSGTVYFTDSSDIAPERIGTRTWDTMYAAKMDYVRGKRTGRLLQYNPQTNEVSVLASGMWFANGVAMDKDETFIVISETFAPRLLKYHLKGAKKGQIEVLAHDLPGYPDGADCSFTTGMCYAPLPSSGLALMKKISKLPHPIDAMLRTLLMMLPKSLAPKVVPYGCVVEVFPGDDKSPGKITRILQDPNGQDIGMLTGVTVHNNKIYMGSLHDPFIGVYDLD